MPLRAHEVEECVVWADLWGADPDQRAPTHARSWSPARVLAECEAKRRIVSDYGEWVQIAESDPDADYATNSVGRLADVLWSLAFPFSNHPDFREEWRP